MPQTKKRKTTQGFSDAERVFELMDKAERKARRDEWLKQNIKSKHNPPRKEE